jgi:hypothetical protein
MDWGHSILRDELLTCYVCSEIIWIIDGKSYVCSFRFLGGSKGSNMSILIEKIELNPPFLVLIPLSNDWKAASHNFNGKC